MGNNDLQSKTQCPESNIIKFPLSPKGEGINFNNGAFLNDDFRNYIESEKINIEVSCLEDNINILSISSKAPIAKSNLDDLLGYFTELKAENYQNPKIRQSRLIIPDVNNSKIFKMSCIYLISFNKVCHFNIEYSPSMAVKMKLIKHRNKLFFDSLYDKLIDEPFRKLYNIEATSYLLNYNFLWVFR